MPVQFQFRTFNDQIVTLSICIEIGDNAAAMIVNSHRQKIRLRRQLEFIFAADVFKKSIWKTFSEQSCVIQINGFSIRRGCRHKGSGA